MLGMIAAEFVLIQILNFGFGIEWKKTLFLTHIMIVILAVYLFLALLTADKEERKNNRQMLLIILPLVTGGLLDLAFYYGEKAQYSAIFFKIGLFLFVLLQAVYNYRKYLSVYRHRIEANAYKELAYKDGLTKLSNRLAYEEALEALEQRGRHGQRFGCFSIDINNLKKTNDQLGHAAGDRLICGVSSILQTAVGDTDKIYRVGGDEFFIMTEDIDEKELTKKAVRIENERQKYNSEHKDNIEFAIGSAWINNYPDDHVRDMVRRADEKMYQMKRRQKEMQR